MSRGRTRSNIEVSPVYGQLSTSQKMSIANLQMGRMGSVALDFPDRTDAEISEFVCQTQQTLIKPNTPSALRKPGQRNTNQLHILASRFGAIVGHLSITDSVSSKLPHVYGSLERAAKLNIPIEPLLSRRYAAIGHITLSKASRELMQQQAERGSRTFLDDMIFSGLTNGLRQPSQTVTVHPFEQQTWLTDRLAVLGFQHDQIFEESVPAFGEDSSVELQRWTFKSVAAAVQALRPAER